MQACILGWVRRWGGDEGGEVGGQAVLGRQVLTTTPWHTERHGYDPTSPLHPPWEHEDVSRRPSGLRKTSVNYNSLAHRTAWVRCGVTRVDPQQWWEFKRWQLYKTNTSRWCWELNPGSPVYKTGDFNQLSHSTSESAIVDSTT